MQELMQWMEETEFMVNVGFIDKVNECLEKEKEQMQDFAKKCLDKALDLDIRTAYDMVEEYYNQTYNQNK